MQNYGDCYHMYKLKTSQFMTYPRRLKGLFTQGQLKSLMSDLKRAKGQVIVDNPPAMPKLGSTNKPDPTSLMIGGLTGLGAGYLGYRYLPLRRLWNRASVRYHDPSTGSSVVKKYPVYKRPNVNR